MMVDWARPQALWLFLGLLPWLLLVLRGDAIYARRLARWQTRSRLSTRRLPYALPLRLLRVLGLSCVIVAIAQPRWNFSWQDVKRQGADLVIALDVSRSMAAADVAPSRLERAKREIKDLLKLVHGDRVALVLYSGVAFIQCPLTHDLSAFELFLDQAGLDSLPVQGTSLSQALQAAGKALDDGAEASSKGRAVILITDGEDHEGQAIQVASELADRGIAVHTIGVGGQGAPIPLEDGGFLKDSSGHLVVSQPNEAILRSIASAAKGRFVRAANGDFDLGRTYAEFIRPDLRTGEHSSREKVWIERHSWFSAAGLLLFTLESLLTYAWRRSRKKDEARLGMWRTAS